jgi:hypothetical protein
LILFNLFRVGFYAHQYFSKVLNRWGKSSERDIQGGERGMNISRRSNESSYTYSRMW